jgi:DNA-binding transcriptional LysR family regulator
VVSTGVALLEADLGVELFDRSRRTPMLTDAGRVLLGEAQQLLRQSRALDNRAQAFAGGAEVRLTLALDEGLPYPAVIEMLGGFADAFPALELTLLNGASAEVAGWVAAGRADLAFQFCRQPVGPALEQRLIGSVRQLLVAGAGHPLTRLAEVGRRELAQHRQLILHGDLDTDEAFSPMVWRSNSFYNIAELVAQGHGWAVLPLNIARYQSVETQLVELGSAALALAPLPVQLLWPSGVPLGPAGGWLGERLTLLLATGLD